MTATGSVSAKRPWNSLRCSRFISPALILLAAAVATAPLLLRGGSCGDDLDFHLVSWVDCLNNWQHGILFPHWAPSSNYGAGEPRFIFYPPLTWMLGAALGSVLPWQFVPAALTFLLLAATGLATRALAREMLPDGAATLAGCATLSTGYALFTAYQRNAFGELTGGFWIPLLLLFALRHRIPSGSAFPSPVWRRALDRSAVPLALALAGAWLSNVPLGVMAIYLLGAIALAAALLARSWAPILRAAASTALGLALAAMYLLPVAWEQHWADLRQATDDPNDMIESGWLFARHTDPALIAHDVDLHRASVLAVSMLAVALAGLLIAFKRGTLPGNRRWWVPLALILPAVLFLQLPISLPIWNLLPRLRFLQFPWRWLVVLEAPTAIFFAAAVWPAGRKGRRAVIAICSVLFLSASLLAAYTFFQPCGDQDTVTYNVSLYRSGQGFLGTDEYEPPGADDAILATGLPAACLVRDPTTVLGILPEQTDPDADPLPPAWSPTQGSCEATFTFDSLRPSPEHLRVVAAIPHAAYLILRQRTYPAWRVTVNGRPVSRMPQRKDGLMAVPVPQGPVNLSVDWTTTPDVVAGRCLSGLALVLLTALYLLDRKLNRPRL